MFSFVAEALQRLVPLESYNSKTIRDFRRLLSKTEPMGGKMIERHYKTSVSLDNMPDTNSTAGSDLKKSRKTRKKNRWQPYIVPPKRTFSELGINGGWQPYTSKEWPSDSSGRLEKLADKGITNLPEELIVKILSNLDIKNISVCRRVNTSWQAFVDTNHLQALSFSRRLHFRPIAKTVKNYHSFTRGWLTGFSSRGKELAEQLDKFLGNKHFPKILFFNIAELLTKTKRLTYQNVCTVDRPADFIWDNPIFSPDGSHIVTASMGLTAKIWEFGAGQLQHKATIWHKNWLINVSFSPDGSHLVIAPSDRTAKVWGLVGGQWQHKATICHSAQMRGISFSPDGSHLLTACDDGTAKIWELDAGQLQEKATIVHPGMVKSASFSSDGSHIVTASGRTAKIWGLVAEQWQHKATIGHSDSVYNASFSPDGKHIVTTTTAADDHTTKIWERVAGQWRERATIGHSGWVGAGWVGGFSFSPDGSHLVMAFDSKNAKILGLVAGQWREKATIPFSGPISKANFSPDGSHLVTTSGDTATIWGLVGAQWKVKATLQHSGRVRSASFSPDGIHLLTLSRDSTTKIWLLTGC